MSNSNNSSSNRINVPEARQAMDQFKMRSANEVGVNLKNGYNGDLTSREAGDLGKARWSRRFGPYEVRSMSGRAELRWGIVRVWST
ncbi:MAG: alpha/beta-type small acid-soluble spore protein [Oscillospiraceae bacterium]|nr:alpha/beta-type small acid-soluble spore protein [Oscillospiraceae bacterium]